MKTSGIKKSYRIKKESLNGLKKNLQFIKEEEQTNKKLRILQVSIGIIYFWFGILKFVTGLSPAEALAVETMQALTMGLLSAKVCMILLATCETIIGLMLILNLKKKYVIIAASLHLLGTFSPLVIMPEQVFTSAVFFLSMTGQYIIKNLIIFSSLWVLYPSKST